MQFKRQLELREDTGGSKPPPVAPGGCGVFDLANEFSVQEMERLRGKYRRRIPRLRLLSS